MGGHDLGEALGSGLGGDVLGALDGGVRVGEARVGMRRRHCRGRGAGAAGATAPLPGVDGTPGPPPIHPMLSSGSGSEEFG